MNITKGEYSLFSIKSQKTLILERGIAVACLQLSEGRELRIYLLYNFFVKAVFNTQRSEIESLNLNVSGIPVVFFE